MKARFCGGYFNLHPGDCTAVMMQPELYHKYCVPAYQQMAAALGDDFVINISGADPETPEDNIRRLLKVRSQLVA